MVSGDLGHRVRRVLVHRRVGARGGTLLLLLDLLLDGLADGHLSRLLRDLGDICAREAVQRLGQVGQLLGQLGRAAWRMRPTPAPSVEEELGRDLALVRVERAVMLLERVRREVVRLEVEARVSYALNILRLLHPRGDPVV